MKNLTQLVSILIAVLVSTTGAQHVVLYAQEGETVTLQFSLSSQLEYLYWNFDKPDGLQLAWSNKFGGKRYSSDESWNSRLSLSGSSLVINNIQRNNFGTFHCVTQLNGQTSTKEYQVIRLIVNLTPASPLLPGERLTLTCDVETNKRSQIHWLNPQGAKVNRRTVEKTATSQDHGQWTCVVNNDKQTPISISVIDFSPAPSLLQLTSKSSHLTIPCSILPQISWEQIKAKGIKEIYWQFCPKPSSNCDDPQKLYSLSPNNSLTWNPVQSRGLSTVPDVQKGNLSLTRNKGKENDRGEYMCIMEFKNDVTLSTTVHVEFLQIIASPGPDLITGQQLNLTCKSDSLLPPGLNVTWTGPTGFSHPSLQLDPHPTRLVFPEVGTGHSGKWGCAVWQGSKRLASDTIMLKIEPRLSVWMLVIICSAAVIVILLLILTAILCRRRQRKMSHLRHRLCQCKTPKPKGFYRT